MYGVFKKLNNVPLFFYPATIFLPLMAVGFAGVLTWAGEGCKRLGAIGARAALTGVGFASLCLSFAERCVGTFQYANRPVGAALGERSGGGHALRQSAYRAQTIL